MKIAFASIAVLAIACGCATNKKPEPLMSAHNNVTDIGPAPITVTPAPSPGYSSTPLAATPVSMDQTISDTTPAASGALSGSAAGKHGNYTIKKGDTLWSIAKTSYGDGKQYTKIVSANPGLSPSGLRVGQQINIP